MAGRGGKHSPHECRRQRQIRTLHHSASPSQRGAAAASLLDQSEPPWRLWCRPNCRWLVAAASTLRTSAGDTNDAQAHLGSTTASHRGVAASLLGQSEPPWWLRCRPNCRWLVATASTLGKRAGHTDDKHAHLGSVSTLHRGAAAASLLDQSEAVWRLWCRPNCRWLVAVSSTLRTSADGKDKCAPCICLHVATWSSRKLLLDQSEPPWRLSCRPNCRWLVMVASTLHTSASDTDDAQAHLGFALASHHGVAASLLDQSEPP